jgi:CRISPR-associated autoregulator DevR family
MTEHNRFPVYEMSVNVRVVWQAHSMSNAGDDGSNRLLPRCQLLADGTETDACSGAILKHHHAVVLAEYLEEEGCPLCPACRVRDARRSAALVDRPEYKGMAIERILNGCALCDAHGFLVTAKKAASDGSTEARQRMTKHTLIDFSYALALPGRQGKTVQLHTRGGASKEEGQMLMKMTSRSAEYALCVRYKSVGIGADIEQWHLVLEDQQERMKRHRAVLSALRDTFLSPDGALTATMLPHLTGLMGAIVVCNKAGRAPMYSALDEDFIARLQVMASETCQVYPFEAVDTFYKHMNRLIALSDPAVAASWKSSTL